MPENIKDKKEKAGRYGDGCVYQRGNIWWATWSEPVRLPNGKVRRRKRWASSHSDRRSDAVRLLHNKVHDSRHKRVAREGQEAEKWTYEEVRDRWLAHRASKARPQVMRNGQVYFAGRIHLDEFFAGWTASAIDTEDIARFQRRLRERGLGNGIDRAVSVLRAMLRHSLPPERLPRRFPMLNLERREPAPIDARDFEPLSGALPERWRAPFRLAWHSGMRLTEIERLRWRHVNLEGRRLRFPGAKTGRPRSVPLLADTADLLGGLRRGGPDDLVFPGFAETTPRTRAWRRAAVSVGCGRWLCPKCGAALKKFACAEHGKLTEETAKYSGPQMRHTRHTAIRRLTNLGVPTTRVMQMMGHENLPTHMGYNVAQEDEDLALIREKYEGGKL